MIVLREPIKRELPQRITHRQMVVELQSGSFVFARSDRGQRGISLGKASIGTHISVR